MAAGSRQASGAGRVLTMSTVSFTVMFAVWLMFGILGKPIQAEFGLSDVELSWISAVAVLNGSMWRLPAGVLADRIGGRKVMTYLLASGAVASWLVPYANSYLWILALAFLVGFVGNSFSVGIAWNSAWFSPRHQGAALGLFGAGNVGASLTKFIGPAIIYPPGTTARRRPSSLRSIHEQQRRQPGPGASGLRPGTPRTRPPGTSRWRGGRCGSPPSR